MKVNVRKLHVVIVTYNSEKTIKQLLQDLKNILERVVVIDNGSKDNTIPILKKTPKIKVIISKRNTGCDEGTNIAIRYALGKGAKYILVFSPDVHFERDYLKNLFNTFKEDEKIGIVGSKIITGDKKIWSLGGRLDKKRFSGGLIGYRDKDVLNKKKTYDVDYVPGAVMLIKKEVFEKIGYFSEDYFIYYEDVDICTRAKRAGFRVVLNPNAKLVHYASTSVEVNSSVMQYYLARNHLLFVERFADRYFLFREFVRLPKTLWEHCTRKEKFAILGIKDYFLRRFGKSDYWG